MAAKKAFLFKFVQGCCFREADNHLRYGLFTITKYPDVFVENLEQNGNVRTM